MKNKETEKKRPFVPSPTLGVCELIHGKRKRFFELTKNGGHYLMLPPQLLKKTVRKTFEKMKEREEHPLLLITAPNKGFSPLMNHNIGTIVEQFQWMFGENTVVLVEETKEGHLFKELPGNGISKTDVIARLHDTTTYFGTLLLGNPRLNVNPHASSGAYLFHVVNNILAPKEKEAKIFGEEEGLLAIAETKTKTKEELSKFIHRLVTKLPEIQPGLKVLVAKGLDEDLFHAGGRYVNFCPINSDKNKTKKRLRAFIKSITKCKKVAFHRFLYPAEIEISAQRYIAHMRYVESGEENVFAVKLVPIQPIDKNMDIIKLKQTFNTGRKGDVLAVYTKGDQTEVYHVSADEGKVTQIKEDVTIVFGGEKKSSPMRLKDIAEELANTLATTRDYILEKIFQVIE